MSSPGEQADLVQHYGDSVVGYCSDHGAEWIFAEARAGLTYRCTCRNSSSQLVGQAPQRATAMFEAA